jgi:uncharacterized membrane protein YeaQ/YmgE (transglycosylase-associated protein family)
LTVDLTNLVIFLLIGAVAGWLAGMLVRGGGFGLLGNIVIGILGAVVGGLLFGLLGLEPQQGVGLHCVRLWSPVRTDSAIRP